MRDFMKICTLIQCYMLFLGKIIRYTQHRVESLVFINEFNFQGKKLFLENATVLYLFEFTFKYSSLLLKEALALSA